MTEHIELLEREIKDLVRSYERAKLKPGVRSDEIKAIERKLRLKTEILEFINAVLVDKVKEVDGEVG